MHDALIVGAGPGGAATAHFLARQGVDVLLLDRAEFPRDKTCGDGLTPRALRVLDQMSLLEPVRQRACSVDGYEVVAPNRRVTRAPITAAPGALVIRRYVLDDMILRAATRVGASFEPRVAVDRIESTHGAVVAHAEDGRRFQARVGVVATGAAYGLLMRSGILGRAPRAMLAMRAYFEDLQRDVVSSFQLRFDDVPQPGYGWIFPVDQRSANVGVGFLPGPRSLPIAVAFGRFLRGRAIQPILAGARQSGPTRGYPIRVDFLRARTHAERTLLVGEAAGLVNPLTGEGIDYALESGQIAAEFLAARLANDSLGDFAPYDHVLHQRFDNIFRFSEWIRDWYCKPPVLNLLVPLANRRPELRQMLAAIVLGEREPRGYGPITMLARLLAYLATTRPRRLTP